jgi:3-hydroxybutyryl-CoA dehydrogenase
MDGWKIIGISPKVANLPSQPNFMKKDRMNVLVVGDTTRLAEFQQLEIQQADCSYHNITTAPLVTHWQDDMFDLPAPGQETPDLSQYDVVFDLVMDDHDEHYDLYLHHPHLLVFGSTAKTTLSEFASTFFPERIPNIFGINALPTFLNRPLLEVSCLPEGDYDAAADVLDRFGLKHVFVKDQVGFVSARVVCMIINEAYFVYGEGTADQDAVDNAMKLGTNYPHGPFAWGRKIGLMHVKELLDALHDSTNDSRYKVAPALNQAAQLSHAFQG